MIGKDRALASHFANAEAVQRGKRIRPELNPRPNLTNFMGLFQQHNFNTLARQRQRGRCAANTATHDNCACHFSHCRSPYQAEILSC